MPRWSFPFQHSLIVVSTVADFTGELSNASTARMNGTRIGNAKLMVEGVAEAGHFNALQSI
jgi:hypothetical protein